MAKQMGTIKVEGTFDGICFYKLDEDYYARRKSGLAGERVKKSKAFRKTMQYAELLTRASVISAAVYRLLPKKERSRKVYQVMTGEAMRMLKDGMSEKEVMENLKSRIF